MKLGVFSILFSDRSLEEAMERIAESGLEAIEIGTGGFLGDVHCKPDVLLNNEIRLEEFKHAIEKHNLVISALSCHGNPLHPDQSISIQHHQQFEQTVRLASKLGVKNVVTFAGCPGESDHSLNPSWVTCPWPKDFADVLEWQWEKRVIPYWKEQSEFLRKHDVRVAIEPHPGFVVYNNETALRLRKECGDNIGVNFDPSHLFWQQMDPVTSIKEIARHNALYHFHAKDTAFDADNMARNGVLDTKPYSDELNRSWIFRTLGYGSGEEVWKKIISTLQLVGYNGVISIEHEDSLMSAEEGFDKAVSLLKSIVIKEKVGEMWWA